MSETGWTTPDAEPVIQPAGSGAPEGADATGVVKAVAPAARPLLGPMTVADIVDESLQLLKRRPRTVLTIVATFAIPVELLQAWVTRELFAGVEGDGLDDIVDSLAEGEQSPGLFYLFAALESIGLTFVAAAIAALVAGSLVGRELGAGEALGVAFRSAWSLIAAWTIVHVAELAGLAFFFLPGLILVALFVPVAPIIGAERSGPLQAVGRAANLGGRRFWRTMWLALLVGISATVLRNLLPLLPFVITLFLGFDVAWPISAAAAIATELIVLPFVATTAVYIYLDLRIRTEGFDIDLAAGSFERL